MTNVLMFLLFLAVFALAAIASVYDPKPLRKPREWDGRTHDRAAPLTGADPPARARGG